MSVNAKIRAEAEALQAIFTHAGAAAIEAPMLIPADTLLDLYGEDIRARAFTTHDPDRGELMLRPDFTVPVVQMHMEQGAEPARYTYLGEVFRMQDGGSNLPSEYLQLGYEVFDRANPMAADAEVFALMWQALGDLSPRAVTGDMGLILAAIEALSTTPARKAALRRHMWRPRRFRALLDQFTGTTAAPNSRARYLEAATEHGLAHLISEAGPPIGLRDLGDMQARLARLQAEADTPPIAAAEAEVLTELIGLRASVDDAQARLEIFAVDLPGLQAAVDRFATRAAALRAAGIDTASLPFEGSYGRSQMEYYDGFVFGILAPQPGLRPLATGGRYDALTRVLGMGREIPAVGGVIRPELVAQIRRKAQ